MGIFDKVKKLADKHADKVEDGLDKVGGLAGKAVGAKHKDKVDKAVGKAKDFVGEKGDEDDNRAQAKREEPPSRLEP